MTLNIKIELLKVFTLELSFDSDKKLKKEKTDEKDAPAELPSGKSASPGK
jgi:hypothetical protein